MAIPVSKVLSHWTKAFPFTSMSSNEFYELVKKAAEEHNIPDCTGGRVTHKQGGLFSASREYFRIKRKDLVFDICAAPFGSHFFVSWWLYESDAAFTRFFRQTKFGNYLQQRAAKRTFFQVDEEYMFQTCVHECILEIVDSIAEKKGLRKLTNEEKIFTKGGL